MTSKFRLTVLAAILAIFGGATHQASAQSIKDILSSLSSSKSGNDSTSASGSSRLGDILSAVGKTVSADVEYKSLVGSWDYTGAAVGFQSDNLLQKAGGAAAATALEKQITPYYQKAGLTSAKIVFNEDSTFTMTIKKAKLSGSIVKGTAKNSYVFSFKALGKVSLGKINGYVVSEGVKTISLTFDASKLITLVDKVASISGNASIKTLSTLLNSYDGCTLGFKMKQTSETTEKQTSR